MTHAKALKIAADPVPEPSIEDRVEDFVFVYQRDGKTVTVIVGKDGGIADTATP